MNSKKISYKNWLFEVDFDRTQDVYQKTAVGSPEQCGCTDCKNFAQIRENTYPPEIKNLFAELGVDYSKESEIFHIQRLDNGLHQYSGWFHFKGKIIEGKDCKIDLGDGGSTFDTEPVTDHFRIAFMKDCSLPYFEEEEENDLIQIEFITETEWVIEKELESE